MNRFLIVACVLACTVLLTAHAQDAGGPSDAGVPYNLDGFQGEGQPPSVVPFDQVGPVYPQAADAQPVFPYEDPNVNEVGGEAGIPSEPQETPEGALEVPNVPEQAQGEDVPAEPQEPAQESEPEQSLPEEQAEEQPQEGAPNEPEEAPRENESEAGERGPQPEESQPDNGSPDGEEAPQESEEGAGEEPEAGSTPEEAEEGTGSEPEAGFGTELPEQPEEGRQEEGESTAGEPEEQPEPQPEPEETEPRVIVPESAGTEGTAILPECPPDSQSCVGPDGNLCGDHGSCVCGSCVCESSYSGRYCQTCPTCPLPCQETSACVRCMVFNDGPLAGPRCSQECRFSVQTVDNLGNSENTCSVLDASDCKITYALDDFFDKYIVKVKQAKDCPRIEGRRPNLLKRFLYGARNVGRKVWNLVKTGLGGGPSVEINYNAAGQD